MRIISDIFQEKEIIPSRYTCDGGNIHPRLFIEEISSQAKSLALIVDDPDATSGKTFTHWTIWNILPGTNQIEDGRVPPEAIEGMTDFGSIGYGGPCPPKGNPSHRYIFKLFALNKILELPAGASRNQLEKEMAGYIIDKAEYVGLYGRK